MDLELKCSQVRRVDLMGTVTVVTVVGGCSRWLSVIFATWYSVLV